MTTVGFTIRFHSPFRVGAAAARDGVAAAIDPLMPLPGDHLKGLMRSAARDLLHLPRPRVAQVYGGTGPRAADLSMRAIAGAWSWTAAEPTGEWTIRLRHRVAIDPSTHTALTDHLVGGEQAWADSARFQVLLMGHVPAADVDWHRLVLRASASAVHGLGAWRRRGLGWVSIIPDEPLTPADAQTLVGWRHTSPVGRTSG